MQIPANSALLAAQNFAGAQALQPPRPASAPRRIDAFDLADLASKPDTVTKTGAAGGTTPASAVQATTAVASTGGAPRGESAPHRADQRPLRPGSTLDIKV
jgi:hypothetical protein